MQYPHIHTPDAPPLIREAVKLLGVGEIAGPLNNPTVIAWSKEMGGWEAGYYTADSIPWCGLFMAIVAKRAGRKPPKNWLAALSWAAFEEKVKTAALGDVLVFVRKGGGHVGIYVGEDATNYYVLGGNQSDAVTVTKIAKARLYSIQRPEYLPTPPSVKPYTIGPNNIAISQNEA